MKNTIKILALGVAIAASATMAKASSISGALNFTGNDTFGGTNSSTYYIDFTNDSVSATGTGTLNVFGTTAVVSPITLNSSIVSGENLFTVTEGGNSLDFLVSSYSWADVSGVLIFTANGTLQETGYADTFGSFTVDTQGEQSYASFSASTAAAPEPSSLALLGTSLLGAAGIARRRFASKFSA